MRRLVSSLYYAVLLSLCCALVAVAFGYYLFARSLPDYSQEVATTGINAPVEIVRDTFNVPHIFASSDADAMFALGYVHAQDRLWQMELARREAQGRMAEVFGVTALAKDRKARHLGFYRSALADVNVLSVDTQRLLQAYAAGVNAHLTYLSENPRGRGAPEFYFSSPQIAPWRPADSLALLRKWAWDQSDQLVTERLKAELLLATGSDLTAEILPKGLSTRPTPLIAGVSRENSITERPLLVASFSAPITTPSVAFAVHLSDGSGQQFGLTAPGMPFFFAGVRPGEMFATGAAQTDVMDLSIIPNDILPRGVARNERILVEDSSTHTEEIVSLEKGVILDAQLFDLDAIIPPDHSAVLQWTGLYAGNTSIEALLGMTFFTAGAFEVKRQTDLWVSLDTLHATNTRMYLLRSGHGPNRSPWQGSRTEFPYLADRLDALWASTSPNVDVEDGSILSQASPNSVRDARFQRLIGLRDIHTLSSLKETQLDTISASARAILPLLARELWFSELPSGEDQTSQLRSESLDLLADWNGDMSEHLPQPLIYSAWIWEFQRQVIRDELGPVASQFKTPQADFLIRVLSDHDGMSHWCDIKPSSNVETCDDIARRALNVALLRLEDAYGPRVASWLWGDAHFAHHAHALFPAGSLMDWISGIYQPVSGSSETLNQTYAQSDDGVQFDVQFAPIARVAVDLSNAEQSGFILSTGQSGHFLSEYYDNLAPLWKRGEYIPISFTDDVIRAGAVGTTWMRPEN